MTSDRFHRAARDGYLDLLRDTTRKDCNAPDEDGMTPTLWAAYHGNLDALRLLVGRGCKKCPSFTSIRLKISNPDLRKSEPVPRGISTTVKITVARAVATIMTTLLGKRDPDKCDHYGNTALHCASANGHMNCVSFLIHFGVNLWALDNDLHTPKDLAGINGREEILRFLDGAIAKQCGLNKKNVAAQKEKAYADAEKRIKAFQKLQKKALKRAEKEEKKLLKERKKMEADESAMPIKPVFNIQNLRKDSKLLYLSPKYSDIVNVGTVSSSSSAVKKHHGGVQKKIFKKKEEEFGTVGGDFKIREVETDGKRSVRSLSGLRRDSEIIFVPKTENGSRRQLQEVFEAKSARELLRTTSEPDFLYHADSGIGDDGSLDPPSLFDRPGFGTVAFRQNSICAALGSIRSEEDDRDSARTSDRASNARSGGSGNDSIGSAGSLAHRNRNLPWDEDDVGLDDDLNDALPIELFLAANGLVEFLPQFLREHIDLEALMLLTEDDLKAMGLPLGPRRKLLKAIDERKMALKEPGEVVDSRL